MRLGCSPAPTTNERTLSESYLPRFAGSSDRAHRKSMIALPSGPRTPPPPEDSYRFTSNRFALLALRGSRPSPIGAAVERVVSGGTEPDAMGGNPSQQQMGLGMSLWGHDSEFLGIFELDKPPSEEAH